MPVVVVPQILLCGLFVERAQMAGWLQAISDVLPMTYAVQALQEVGTHGDADRHALARSRHRGRLRRAGPHPGRRDPAPPHALTRVRRGTFLTFCVVEGAPINKDGKGEA